MMQFKGRVTFIGFIISVCGLLSAAPVFSWAPVESRNGEAINNNTGYTDNTAYSGNRSAPTPSEDRAARLTLQQMEVLQREVAELRGLVEEQDHEIKRLKKSNQDLYMDLDRRLSQIQSGKTPAPTATGTAIKVKPPKTSPSASTSEEKKELYKPSQPIARTTSEREAYESAYSMVRSKQYSEAVSAFTEYLHNYPKGEHVANAHYWLGEVYMVQWQSSKTDSTLLEKASQEFKSVQNKFPNHSKTVDAILKLGLIELDKDNQMTARQYLSEVKERFPGTAAAHIAETRLSELNYSQ